MASCMEATVVVEEAVSIMFGRNDGQSSGFVSGVHGLKIYHIQALSNISSRWMMILMNLVKTSSIQTANHM
jgi:hypothetical protein